MRMRRLRIYLVLFLALFFTGCVSVPRPYQMPLVGGVYHIVDSGQTLYRIAKVYNVDLKEIMRANNIQDPRHLGVGQELFIPGVRTPLYVEPYKPRVPQSIRQLVGPRYISSRWRFITIHHSATSGGNAGSFDRTHRRRRMGGLFYHFVIGNGRGAGDGEIETGWRWKKQKCANRPQDIQICLVGNFNYQNPSSAQLNSLSELIQILQKQYSIPYGNIRRHKDVPGVITECPGRNFSLYRLLAELKK
jgi:N-acetylmuramoyl-L-alanine amidase